MLLEPCHNGDGWYNILAVTVVDKFMKILKQNWFLHLLSLVVLGILCYSIYLSSQNIDYQWRWQRVVPYIVDTSPQPVFAPRDGTVQLDQQTNQLSVIPDSGEEPFIIAPFDSLLVSQGDLVFEGDAIASVDTWRLGPIANGLLTTLKISSIALVFAIIIGLLVGIARTIDNPLTKNLTLVNIEIIRGTPLLVQIFIFYFFIGTVLNLDRMTAGIAALAVFSGAYIAEIVRAGIQSIPPGQMEAAKALGMSYIKAMRFIILPQAIRKTLPPMIGQFINLVKDSSLVSVIAITDLTKAGREVVSSTFAPFEVWFTVALLYLVLTGALSVALQKFELNFKHDR